ncbi:MAG: CDP-alcohol phosphatidyltransferase family protein [Gammaproteobacteria bacterium]
MMTKPWDARLAAQLVKPLCGTPVTPNHLTTVRLFVGISGALLFAHGGHANLAAAIVVLSNFLDHTDGELARMKGATSRFGHYYDLISDAVVTVGLFCCIGWGLVSSLGHRAIWMGVIAGLAIAAIFHLRQVIENRLGKGATAQPRIGGFEAEDILYLLPLVTLFDRLATFLHAAAVGAPIALLVVFLHYRRLLASP